MIASLPMAEDRTAALSLAWRAVLELDLQTRRAVRCNDRAAAGAELKAILSDPFIKEAITSTNTGNIKKKKDIKISNTRPEQASLLGHQGNRWGPTCYQACWQVACVGFLTNTGMSSAQRQLPRDQAFQVIQVCLAAESCLSLTRPQLEPVDPGS